MAVDWATGFLAQAHSDYLMYRGLNAVAVPKCHVFHYLQMFTEKAAKAGLASGSGDFKEDHRSLVRFLKLSKQDRRLRALWEANGGGDLSRTLDGLQATAMWIQELYPKKDSPLPNPEYPWAHRFESPPGSGKFAQTIMVPCEYDFLELSAKQAPKLQKLVNFFEWYFRSHNLETPGESYQLHRR